MFSSLLPIPAAGVYYAFEKSDLVGQAIVIFLLFGSVFTWTIMIEKGVYLVRCKKMSELFMLLMKRRRRLSEMYRESRNDASPLACVYKAGMDKLMEFYAISPDQLLMGPDHYNVRKLSEIQKTLYCLKKSKQQMKMVRSLRCLCGLVFQLLLLIL